MPWTLTRDDQRRRLAVIASGRIGLDESLALLDQQVSDGTWGYAVLYDGRAREGTLTALEVRRIEEHTARLTRRHGAPGPLAVLRTDDAGFGVGRMFQIYTHEQRAMAVFRDADAALAWLDAQPARDDG